MGRPKKPTKLKELNGSLKRHPDRRNPGEPKPAGPIGEPPAYFDQNQASTWAELFDITPAGVLTSADRIHLEIVCVLLAHFRRDPESFLGVKLAALNLGLAKMGLNPSDRSRIRASTEPQGKPDDPWEQFGN